MKNKEKFAQEIANIAVNGVNIAVDRNNVVVPCGSIKCIDCLFRTKYGECGVVRKRWANSEYERFVDWSKVPVDTPLLVKDIEDTVWKRRYFAKYEDDEVWCWADGSNSWSSEDRCKSWRFAKLYNTEESV